MTRAPTPEALRSALARGLDPEAFEIFRTAGRMSSEAVNASARMTRACERADALIAGPLAPILKALADVKKERDEARAEADRRKAEREITDIRIRNQRAAIRGLHGNETAFAYWIKSRVVLTQLCRERMREVHATRAECDALKGEVERLTNLLRPIQKYAKVALRPEIDIGDGEIGEMIHGGLRHSIRTQDLRAIRDADLSRAALAQEARDDASTDSQPEARA